MFQESEIICLAFGVVVLAFLVAQRGLPRLPLIYAGIVLVVCAQVLTVAEGVVWPSVLNPLEHVCYALAGVAFAAGIWRLARRSRSKG
ncbi:MAG: hypothetical protein ACYS5V_01670 [Planctomycetota bacterium]|jgi:hypothetical protein